MTFPTWQLAEVVSSCKTHKIEYFGHLPLARDYLSYWGMRARARWEAAERGFGTRLVDWGCQHAVMEF